MPAQLYFIHPDHLGTPRAITKASDNTKVWEWKNDDPFGANLPDENPNNANGSGSSAQPFKYNLRFPGQYFDQETNTNYNYFRDYDPSVGRYVQSDPIGLGGGVNTYAYVNANPIKRIDQHGLFSGADAALSWHFYTGGERYMDISKYCGEYMADPSIRMLSQFLKQRAAAETRRAAGRLTEGQTDFYYTENQEHLYLSLWGIYSFGEGLFHFQKMNCKITGEACRCASAQCQLNFSAVDLFRDPIDLCQQAGLCGKKKNLGGTPFWFGLNCNDSFTTRACK